MTTRRLRTAVVCVLVAWVAAFGLPIANAYDEPVIPQAATQQAKLTASDGVGGDRFGISVAVSGDTAVVGTPFGDGPSPDQGAAYVYTRTEGIWKEQAKLTASDGMRFDRFGMSVAIAGDTAVISAVWDTVGVNALQGSAYVFTRTGDTWTEQAKLTASDGGPSDWFGYSVAVSGDTAVISADFDNLLQGSAYVFTRAGSTWTEQAKLTAADGAIGDEFGRAVAVSGDTAVVGAFGDEDGVFQEDQGAAYVFARTGDTWTQQSKLMASDRAAGDAFGHWVGVSGDTAVVGSYFDDIGANTDQGSAYVFTRTAVTWTEQAKLAASDGAADDVFGRSVAVSGDNVVVGAQWDDVGANADQGSAYVFVRTGGAWNEQAKLTDPEGRAGDLFGVSVAVAGATAIVGAGFADVGNNADQGAANVFALAEQ